MDNDLIEISVSVKGQTYTKESILSYTYFKESAFEAFADPLEMIDAFTTEADWNITDEYVYEGSFSLSDSPYVNYRRNATTSATLNETFDFTNVAYAEITFAARWEIENDYDYAMVQASTDGVNWTPLCGLYTNPGSEDQILDEPLYDNFQSDWVNEVISLQDYVGEESVQLRFLMHSDGFIEEEGIYIDDLKINTIEKSPSSNINTDLTNWTIKPNPASSQIIIEGITSMVDYEIYNLSGIPLLKGTTSNLIDISHLPKGLYFVSLNDGSKTRTTRLIKL